jgi:Reverse transcriptase (RNA-dependent DNA polymerase)
MYNINYDESFTPVTKMSTVKTLVSCSEWGLDVKNIFIYEDLLEEVYMEILSSFSNTKIADKVCRLRKSLYGLKQILELGLISLGELW